MINCLIVDDEPNAVSLLEDYILKVDFLNLRQKCYDAFEVVTFLRNNKVDLIFLDINMPNISGLELASMLPKDQCIIFTTAYSSHAMEGYEYNAIDYLLKPITFKRFMQAIRKTEGYFALRRPAELKELTLSDDTIFIKSGKQIMKMRSRDILYCKANKEYVNIVCINESVLIYRRMKQLEEQLPPNFIRIHNSYIINLDHLEKIVDNQVLIRQTKLPISTGYREQLLALISKKLF
ncbi:MULTISPECIES: LytR/AlgR family response regulator transcription factor [Olivibacter]|uniref:LytR/AlgR family response regulator transcription factor n=1 Tax=Olivibacter jilunii TaxID=985016 RepID=A0ABW6B4T2_9SPHI